jgi:hypothetical protein
MARCASNYPDAAAKAQLDAGYSRAAACITFIYRHHRLIESHRQNLTEFFRSLILFARLPRKALNQKPLLTSSSTPRHPDQVSPANTGYNHGDFHEQVSQPFASSHPISFA